MAAQSKFARLLKNVLLVLLIIAVSVGATLYYSWQQGKRPNWASWKDAGTAEAAPTARPSPAPVAEKPLFSTLEPFTVTLNENGRSRILYVGISLQVTDEQSRKVIHEFMPVVRDRVLQILAEQIPSRIQTPEGREELVRSLSQGLQTPYEPSHVAPRISNVLFTAFVIQ